MKQHAFKIKHGVNPVGTKHRVTLFVAGRPGDYLYECYLVFNAKQFSPNGDEPDVRLRLAERTGENPPMYLALPLSELARSSKPKDKSDLFYEPSERNYV